jgi:hypothetical protein
MFQTSLAGTPERDIVTPRGLVTRQYFWTVNFTWATRGPLPRGRPVGPRVCAVGHCDIWPTAGLLYAQFVPSRKTSPAVQFAQRDRFLSPINDLKLAMVDRHLIITRTPSDGIEFGLAHSLGA